jgi:hypothetical protein
MDVKSKKIELRVSNQKAYVWDLEGRFHHRLPFAVTRLTNA